VISRRSLLLAAAMGATVLCAGCAGRPSQGVLVPISETVDGTSRVPILVATTRRRSTTDPGEMFDGERANSVSYAAVTVSIPPDAVRRIGHVQWPSAVPGDPRRDFVTLSANYIDKKDFAASIDFAYRRTGRNKVLVFVHGFNNRFDDAVYRFAQIVHDSKSPAIPVLFTWPSRGDVRLRSYAYDRESANYSRDALEELLDTIVSHPNVKEINIVAHSMGNWVALEALRGRSIRGARVVRGGGDKVKNALLVAPDVDLDVFATQIRRMGAYRPRIALFVSQDDGALELSKLIWGGMPRIGEADLAQEPYRTVLERERIAVFDLTKLKSAGDNAHSRAFDDITQVMAMISDWRDTGPTGGARQAQAARQSETVGLRN
jgi:esterase/lipase superfamily enzyme